MNAISILFYFFLLICLGGAIGVLLSKNIFYAALYFLVCLLSLAGIFIFLSAEYIAVTQIMVYAGGVLVVIIFGIMLTGNTNGKPVSVQNSHWFSGIILGATIVGVLIPLLTHFSIKNEDQQTLQSSQENIHQIGQGIMTDYILPFEIAGILLLMTLIGAAVSAHKLGKGHDTH